MATAKPKSKTAVATAKTNLPANLQQEMAAELASFQKRLAAPSGDKIKCGKRGFALPNGDTAETLSVIIVDFVSVNKYYENGYDENNIVPPNCIAIGLEPSGLIPSDNSPDKQNDACASCWANQWKSAQKGNGKACSNRKLLAVMSPDDDGTGPLMIVDVSSTGLKSFDSYVSSVARTFQRPPRGVITEITYDPNLDYVSLRFGNPQPCTPEQFALAYSRKEEAMTRLLTEPDLTQAEAPAKAAPKGRGGLKAPVKRKVA
jgi:hypothetical protein